MHEEAEHGGVSDVVFKLDLMMASPTASGHGAPCSLTRRMEHTFYAKSGKRMFDFVAAAIGTLVLSPALLVLLLLVKLTSPGPVFYRQERVGRNGKSFRIVKFRSMFEDADKRGPAITSAGDHRITALGRLLRRFKLDELPQLWNVLRGEMSLVGPRPEVPCYVESYSDSQRRVLAVRPGITDPGSIRYRHEEQVLGDQPDPDRYYREVVLPDKLNLNLEYLSHMSFSYDLSLLLRTTGCIVLPKGWLTRTP
jgi:lipopolysaccharide/colanic/teichoic acid biosynthesis glycosyltransferase